jgi:SulP family sulfate permease
MVNKKRVSEYFKRDFLSDFKAGFITAVVALPLAIAFAIASGVDPIMGLYTAIIAGILGSSIGGSNFSITGPTGAMAVIILSTVNKYGIEGLLLAGFLAGLLQIIFGLIKLGKLVKYIPLPVITGFTAGIGAIIFIGQLSNALGLSLASKEHVWETISEIIVDFAKINYIALAITLLTILIMVFSPKLLSKTKFAKNIPPSVIMLVLSSLAVFFFALNIPVVGTIARGFPHFSWINFNLELLKNVFPASFTIAMLGAIEALLCAVVCDAMTNTKHKSDKELISQGVNNLVLPFFGGIPCTAAIARSAVNIREGAKTRAAGIIHGLFLLLTVLFLAPLAFYIPKAFLAGVLMVVSVRMFNLHEIKVIVKTGKQEAIILLTTFLFTIFTDLVFAVQVGMLLAFFLVFVKLTQVTNIKSMEEYDATGELNSIINTNPLLKDRVSIYTIHGPFFFGAMNVFEEKLTEHMYLERPVIILRMKHVPFVDSSGLVQLVEFIKTRKKHKSQVIFTEFWPGVKEHLMQNPEFKKHVSEKDIFKTVQQALDKIKRKDF